MIRELAANDVFYLLFAARWTVALTVVSILGGGLIGIVVMVLRVVSFRPAKWLAIAYIQGIQGTPLLGLLFVIYFGIGVLGQDVSAWIAASVAIRFPASPHHREWHRYRPECAPSGPPPTPRSPTEYPHVRLQRQMPRPSVSSSLTWAAGR